MSIRKNWYISLMRADSARSMNFTLGRSTGYVLLFVLLFFVLVVVGSAYYVWSKNSELAQLTKLQRENDILRNRMTHFTTQMDSLLIKIRIMEDWEDNMRQDRRLPVINTDVRALGSGGFPFSDPVFLPFCDALHKLYNENLTKLNYVSAKIELTFTTHFDLISSIQSRESLYKSTPSIWPTFGKVTSSFGNRIHPIFKSSSMHAGLDIANEFGTPIYATADGTVSFTGRSASLGYLIRIDHASGYQTRYGHLQRILVKAGDTISKGQIIATMGSSGNSTGSHLHYEILDFRRGRVTNPVAFLNITEDQLPTPTNINILVNH